MPDIPDNHVMTSDGVIRRVLGTLPISADGCVVGLGADIWTYGAFGVGHEQTSDDGVCTGGYKYDSEPLERVYSTEEAATAAWKKLPPPEPRAPAIRGSLDETLRAFKPALIANLEGIASRRQIQHAPSFYIDGPGF